VAGAKTYRIVATIRKSEGIPLSTVSSERVWSSFPANLALAKDEIHVWLAGLNDPGIGLKYFADYLSLAERNRAAQFKFLPDRRRYLVAHAALRSILGMYLNVHPVAIEFGSGPVGKPKLAHNFASSELGFNLSHSGEIALIAVTRGSEIGVDVERIREDFAFEPIAQRFFTANEVAALQDLPVDLQREAFYKCWTSKEALLKAKGTGLSGSLDEVQIMLMPGARVRVTPPVGDWSLIELSPIGGYAAALAAKKLDGEPQCYRWEPSFLESKLHS
jgi:4'-phosphopantetheinyl transferase